MGDRKRTGWMRSAGTDSQLALLGGLSVHEKEWPAWPRAGMTAQRAVLDVLHSQRWTITARTQRVKCYEQQFGDAFAGYIDRRYGVPCSSGSAALTIALQSCGIGPGDEVIVPGMTWVACASVVTHLGAVPILVDIEPYSLCMDPLAVAAAVSPVTKAVMAVHMYSSRADIESLMAICHKHNLILIEDASQAHGAILGRRRTGSFGSISVFSFQQTKLLTSGEGGIALTDDADLYERLQKLRSDGRIYGKGENSGGFHDLVDQGGLMGRNMCLTEFQAAILLEGLQRLDRENDHRKEMAAKLADSLNTLGGVQLVRDRLSPSDGATFYKVVLRFSSEEYLAVGPETLARALTAELNLPVEPLDRPLDRNPLYSPLSAPLISRAAGGAERWDPQRFSLSTAVEAWKSCVALPHQCLLGGEQDVDAIVTALVKIKQHARALTAINGQG